MVKNHSILIVVDPREQAPDNLKDFSNECGCEIIEATEIDILLERVQQKKFDVIILDAEMQGMQIERLIHILREMDPQAKIIVKARQNTKNLEAKIRQAKVFYYHIHSFGIAELKLAIKSALAEPKS